MPWIRVDDHFDEHPKLAAVGPLGMVMWMAGLAYCNRNLTDGFIPWAVAESLVPWDFLDRSGPSRVYVGSVQYGVSDEGAVSCSYVARLLVDAGLWAETRGGYLVHDYGDYQPTKAQVQADRDAKVAAGRAGGIATAAAHAQHRPSTGRADGVADGVAQSKPVPKPVPVPVPVSNPIPTGDGADAPPVKSTPRQVIHRWLSEHGAAAPVGWVNTTLNELVKVYGSDRIVTLWDQAPADVRTSKQFVQLAERTLSPTAQGRNGDTPRGHTRSSQEVEDAFR